MALLGSAGGAAASPLVVPDFADGSDVARATSILVRSLFEDRRASVVPLARAIAAGAGSAPAREVMARLQATHLLSGEVRQGEDSLRAQFVLEAADGRRLIDSSVAAAPGDVLELAQRLARVVAPEVGLTPRADLHASLGALRPFARAAAALAGGDAAAAAAALLVARPEVAREVAGARDVADAIFGNAALPLASRLRAGRLALRFDEALALAQAERHPDAGVRAEHARLLMAAGQLDQAASLLAHGSSGSRSPELAVARAELAMLRASPDAARLISEQVRPLIERRPADLGALVFVLGLPPHLLDDKTEAAALAAAVRLPPEQADVAGEVAVRSARAGGLTSAGAALVRVDDLEARDVPLLLHAARSLPLGGKLLEERLATRMSLGERLAQPPASPAGLTPGGRPPAVDGASLARRMGEEAPALPVALAPDLTGAEAGRAGASLAPLLASFSSLRGARGRVVAVARQAGSLADVIATHQPDDARILLGLRQALSSAPYALQPLVVVGPPVAELSAQQLRGLAARVDPAADLVALVATRTSGGSAIVHLTVFDVRSGEATEQALQIDDGSLGFTRWNRALLGWLGGALAAVVLLWLYLVRLTGLVDVKLLLDPGAERHVIAVRLSRSARRPVVEPGEFTRRNDGRHRRGLRLHIGVEDRALFRSLLPGKWYVHVYGAQLRGGQPRALPDSASRSITVKAGGTTSVTVDLRLNSTDCVVVVLDGAPRSGVPVWLDDDRAHAVATNGKGEATLTVAYGAHLIRAQAGDIVAEKRVNVGSSRTMRVTIDAAFERRIANIEIPAEDVAPPPFLSKVRTDLAAYRAERHDTEDLLPDIPIHAAMPIETVHLDGALRGPPTPPPHGRDTVRGVIAGITHGMPSMVAIPNAAGAVTLGQGRYRVLTELGRGAMGVVYRATDTVLEREVAVKVVSDEGRKNPAALQMFVQEAKAMAALNHPNLVTVFDQGQDLARAFMVMELIEGQSLEQLLLDRGRLPWREAVTLIEQICAGLAYAHERRILHRDIKPGNVFVSTSGLVKIGDFGLARAIQRLAITQTRVCGSPAYMAPEQIRGSDLDFRSDLYALGCTLFEMLTGRVPFVEGEPMFHHMYTAPPDPSLLEPAVPRPVARVVLWCLEKEKEKRPASALLLKEALQEVKASASAAGRLPGPPLAR